MTTETPDKDYKSPFTRRIIDYDKILKEHLQKGCNHGVCGGCNLGNTCFMNSSIACLSNCTELTAYFISGEYKKDINKSNKEGLGGKLANEWSQLIQEYWNSSKHTGNPSNVKSAVAKKEKKFASFNQQDSNEFMTVFLSILSEDLNKTTKKDFKELPEKQDNETEIDCAIRFWDLHVKRNDSIITDLFSGLFKSVVSCPKCKWDNITFDPFNTLTLAIPDKKINEEITIFYIPKFSIRKSNRVILKAKKKLPLSEITEEMKKLENFLYKPNKLKYIQVLDQEMKRIVNDNEPKKDDEYIFAFDDVENSENINVIPLYMQTNKMSAFPRLLFLDKNATFLDLKKQIFYFARKNFENPLNKENCEVDDEINKFINEKNPGDIENLIKIFDKEFDEIFNNNNENTKKFLENFPYTLSLKNYIKNKKDEFILFDGNDYFDQLKDLKISKNDDNISELVDKINKNEYYLVIKFENESNFLKKNISLDSCENVTYTEKKKNLFDLIDFFCSQECLDKDNEWYCKKCKSKVSASKKFELYFLPRILTICINRFKGRRSYCKNDEFIDFPVENLDLGKYITNSDNTHYKYDLFAVSQHYGSTGGGHYTAVCKNWDGNWYSYNDSSCRPTSSSDAVSSAAYVLFYRKQNW